MISFILSTSSVAIMRQAHAFTDPAPVDATHVAIRTLDAGTDAHGDGLLMAFRADKAAIVAMTDLAAAAMTLWENGELEGDDGVWPVLQEAICTLSAAHDEATDGELDGLAAGEHLGTS